MSNSRILYALVIAALLAGCPTKTTTRPDGGQIIETDVGGSVRVIQNFAAERQKALDRIADPRTTPAERLAITDRLDNEDNAIAHAAQAAAMTAVQTLLKAERPMTLTITITPSARPDPLPAPSAPASTRP